MARLLFLALAFVLGLALDVRAAGVLITNSEFQKHFEKAQPGDVFTIYPGTYIIHRTVNINANGTKDKPIIVRPAREGKVVIEVKGITGFKVGGANWIFENIEFRGTCDIHPKCEHALHVVGRADNTIIRDNYFVDFNAAIKANGEIINDRQFFPDRVLIERNVIYNNEPRQTPSPVTPIDVVGGRHWVVRDNFIADFQKALGNKISYAAFLKGNSDNGLFERNTVICEWRHRGGTRLGLSFGGGGTTDPRFCQGRSCKIQHYKGTIRGNLIMNCPKDVGIYLNNSANTKIENNTIINTTGVDVRFNGSFATFSNNVIQGRIQDRDGGRHRDLGNMIRKDLAEIFPNAIRFDLTPADMSDFRAAVRDVEAKDLCTGQPQNDWMGAFAYPMACTLQEILEGPDGVDERRR